MEWADAPPTWKQLKYLKQLGYTPDHRLTKTEACELIVKLGGKLDGVTPDEPASAPSDPPQIEAWKLREAVEAAGHAPLGDQARAAAVAEAKIRRQQFWVDTCREVREMHSHSPPVLELYRKHGCLFHTPTPRQAQDILDALDTARPAWEKEHPQLFFETLGLNFPELRRH